MRQILVLLRKDFNLFFLSKSFFWILIIFIISLCSMLRLLLPLNTEQLLFILKTSGMNGGNISLFTQEWAKIFYIVFFLIIYVVLALFVILVSYQWDLENNIIHFFKILGVHWQHFFISKLISLTVFLFLIWFILGIFYFFLVEGNLFEINLYTLFFFILFGILISYISSVTGLLISGISLLTPFSFIFIFVLFIPLQLPVLSIFSSLMNKLILLENALYSMSILYCTEALFLYICFFLYTAVVICLFPYLWDSY